jgi:iron complex transport system substrate-binding protein
MLFLMPCGFHLAETIDEWSKTQVPPRIKELGAARSGQVFALDGSSYFSRPGPRVIDGVEMLAEIMDPEGFVDIAPPTGWAPVEVG